MRMVTRAGAGVEESRAKQQDRKDDGDGGSAAKEVPMLPTGEVACPLRQMIFHKLLVSRMHRGQGMAPRRRTSRHARRGQVVQSASGAVG